MSLTQRDTEILSAAFQSIKGPVKIDWEKLATLAGYKTGASACTGFGLVKKKLNLTTIGSTAGPATPADGDDNTNGDVAENLTPKRGRKAKTRLDADGNVMADTTPKRGRKAKAADGNVMADTTPKRGRKATAADGNVMADTTPTKKKHEEDADDEETIASKSNKRGRQSARGLTPSPKRIMLDSMTTESAKNISEEANDDDAATTTSDNHEKVLSMIKQEEVNNFVYRF